MIAPYDSVGIKIISLEKAREALQPIDALGLNKSLEKTREALQPIDALGLNKSLEKTKEIFRFVETLGLNKSLEKTKEALQPIDALGLNKSLEKTKEIFHFVETLELNKSLEKTREALQPIDALGLNKSLEKTREALQPIENISNPILRHVQLEQLNIFRSDSLKNSLLSKTSLSLVRNYLLPIKSVSLRKFLNLYQGEKQNFSQSANNLQTITVFNKGKFFRSHAKLQNQVLFEIYRQVTANKNEPVEWSPSEWFGSGSGRRITDSQQSKYNNALRKLITKGLVKQEKPVRQFSSNTGNATTNVFLTPAGYAAIKQSQENG